MRDAEQRAALVAAHGTAELPEALVKVRAKTVETFPEAASVFVSTLRVA
ncbi:hypothetical protein [Streptomyces sp. ML-6]|nr:hypothetical protein [Streptomyces sp. ML-6]MDK0520463.1 hypothetical protein [Streptomyces sp. ML-6]